MLSPHKASIQIHWFKQCPVGDSTITTKKEVIKQTEDAMGNKMLIDFNLMRKKIMAALLNAPQIKTRPNKPSTRLGADAQTGQVLGTDARGQASQQKPFGHACLRLPPFPNPSNSSKTPSSYPLPNCLRAWRPSWNPWQGPWGRSGGNRRSPRKPWPTVRTSLPPPIPPQPPDDHQSQVTAGMRLTARPQVTPRCRQSA